MSLPAASARPALVEDTPAPAPAPRGALTTRYLDAWLIGGATVVLWLVMIVADRFPWLSTMGIHLHNTAGFFGVLTLVVNFPHIMASYRLGYGRGRRYVLSHWGAFLAVPAALAAVCATAYLTWHTPAPAAIDRGLSLGVEIMGATYHVMLLTLGYHFVKQAYGVMMVYARLDGYPLTARQRDLIRWSLLALWIHAFVASEVGAEARTFFGMTYYPLGLPAIGKLVTGLVALAGALAVVAAVFVEVWRRARVAPSLGFLAPWAAIYLWWAPIFYQPEYSLYVTQFGHALQYLVFVYKVEKGRMVARSPLRLELRATALIAALVAGGWIFFELIPNSADMSIDARRSMGCLFFLMCSNFFLNIHHYFIDGVIWRMTSPDNKEVRDHLFR